MFCIFSFQYWIVWLDCNYAKRNPYYLPQDSASCVKIPYDIYNSFETTAFVDRKRNLKISH
jgi:hypothetical protein